MTARLGYLDAKNAQVPAKGAKPNILRFGAGLDLWVTSSGQKTWRCKVQRNGNRTTLSLGRFPEMTIKQAEAARAAIKVAPDPAEARRAVKVEARVAAETTFRVVADRWIAAMSVRQDWSPVYKRQVGLRLGKHVLPVWGARPVAEITPTDVLDLISKLRPAVAVAVWQYVRGSLDFAWSSDLIPFNPAAKVAKFGPRRHKAQPQASVRTIEDARRVLAAVETPRPPGPKGGGQNRPSPWTLLAHRLIALTGVRKTEALGAVWSEFDLDAGVWTIPAKRMKSDREHVVPLAPQAVELLRVAARIRRGALVFPASGRFGSAKRAGGAAAISRSSLNDIMTNALRIAGLVDGTGDPIMVPHGWRSSFVTIMGERDFADRALADMMLAHKPIANSHVESHYQFARHDAERRRIACQWADMLLDGAPSALALIGLEQADAASNVVTLADRRAAA